MIGDAGAGAEVELVGAIVHVEGRMHGPLSAVAVFTKNTCKDM